MGASQPGKIVISLGTSDTFFAAMPNVVADPKGGASDLNNHEKGNSVINTIIINTAPTPLSLLSTTIPPLSPILHHGQHHWHYRMIITSQPRRFFIGKDGGEMPGMLFV
jgi:hypothetical protein